jgi:glutathione peroxidase
MRLTAIAALALLLAACATAPSGGDAREAPQGIYAVQARTLDGKPVDFETLKGRVVLVCNAASQCGYASQLDGFEELAKTYGPRGLEIVVMPCDDWDYERDSVEQMREYYYVKNAYTYTILEPGRVKPGPGQSPLFEFVIRASGKTPDFNFYKFLIGRDGRFIQWYRPGVRASYPEFRRDIETALR